MSVGVCACVCVHQARLPREIFSHRHSTGIYKEPSNGDTHTVTIIAFIALPSHRRQIARVTDMRIRMLSDVINGIKVIKLHAWEGLFSKIIGVIRKYVELPPLLRILSKSSCGRGRVQ